MELISLRNKRLALRLQLGILKQRIMIPWTTVGVPMRQASNDPTRSRQLGSNQRWMHSPALMVFATQMSQILGAAMIRAISSLMLMICCVGCDPISGTEIAVDTLASDTRGSEQATAEILSAVENTTEQFGLRRQRGQTNSIAEFTDRIAGEDPSIWVSVNFDKHPVIIAITEMYVSRPTRKHRTLADVLVLSLRANELDAIVMSQSPAISSVEWFVLAATLAAMILLILRRGLGRNRKRTGCSRETKKSL